MTKRATVGANQPGETEALLAIRLLGSPEVRCGEELAAGFRSAKAQALFYYLAARREPVMRATLLGLLWADVGEEQARASLNQALSNLRKVAGEALVVTRQTAALDPRGVQTLDVAELGTAAARAQTLETGALLAAAALYRGELLEGFFVRDAAEFEHWLQGERERMRQAAITLLAEAVRRGERAGDASRTEQALRGLLRIEPWRESAHRQLMRLLAAGGARDAALAQYAACRAALAAALDVEPDAETERVYTAIRSGEIGPEPPTASTGESGDLGSTRSKHAANPANPANLADPVLPGASGRPPHNLPGQATPFVGRGRELAAVLGCLGDPHCRLLTIVGPGGIGKSRLALHVAETAREDAALAQHFADGIFFVALAAVDSTGGMLAAVAEAAGLQFYDHTPAHQQLVSFLAGKRMLLVLDNLEHLQADDALLQWLSDVAATAPQVKLVVTTREALGLQEAWFYPLAGLSLPAVETGHASPRPAGWTAADSALHPFAQPLEETGWTGEADPADSDAVQLFVQSARRARVGFSLSTTHAAVTRICRLVDGAPLAIELAAAWLTVLTAEQVAAELERSLDILTARRQNAPLRHRSMRAVCESSWQLLPPPLAGVMRRLALQRGGFHLAAVTEIAGASLFDLAALVEKSLLRQAENGRYELHELLRQYALERLEESGELEAVRRRHTRYYLDFLQRRGAQLAGSAQRQALDELGEEYENLHAAWQAAVAAGEWELVEGVQAVLYEFLQVRSRYWEGKALFDLAVAALAPVDPPDAAPGSAGCADGGSLSRPPSHSRDHLLLRLHVRQGAFAFYLGQYGEAFALAEQSLAQARALHRAADAAFALNLLGQIAGWQGERERARQHLQESLHLCREAGDRAGLANALHKLAQVYGSVGEYAEARRQAQESFDLCRQLGRPDWLGYALDVLGWVTLCLGDYEACTTHYMASLRLFRASGDRLGTALALGGLGSVEWARGGERLLTAAAYMTESLNLCRAIGHRHHAASRLWYLGQIAVEQEDFWLGRAYGEEGRALAEAVGSPVFVAYNLCTLGAAARGLGERAQAQGRLLAVLRIAGEVQHLPPLLIALIELARLHLAAAPEAVEAPGTVAASRRQLALASLAAVIAHPACWQPYRVRAQRLAEELAAAGTPGEMGGSHPPYAMSVEEVAAAWQSEAKA